MKMRIKGLAVLAAAGLLAGCEGAVMKADEFGATGPASGVTTWVDPDGCEHWVLDFGAEGYMSPKLTRDGRPICGGASAEAMAAPMVLAGDAAFSSGSARLRPADVPQLTALFESLRDRGKNRVRIIGHTDSVGSEAFNQRLSERRAQAVADYAATYGISAEIVGMGESRPVASNATAAGRRQNRRVEIIEL